MRPYAIQVRQEGPEYVAAADACRLYAFGKTEAKARRALLAAAVEHADWLRALGPERVAPRLWRELPKVDRLVVQMTRESVQTQPTK